MNKTRIIALEGIDGGGKSLQKSLLLKRLRAAGYTVRELSFPNYEGFFGRQIGDMLSGRATPADQVDSRSMCLWFALDRWKAFQNYHDGESDFLVLNRYTLSNAVYQSVREIDRASGDNWPWVKALEHGELGLPQPDLYVLFDLDPAAAQQNVDKKGEREYIEAGQRDVYESQRDLLVKARARYLEIAAHEPNFAVISCAKEGRMDPPEKIAERVWAALAARGLVR